MIIRSTRVWLLCSLTAWGGLTACGGSAAAPANPDGAKSTGDTSRPSSEQASSKKFEEMKPGERMDYMKQKVLPRMTAVFQESGSKDFEEVNCVTCHGSRAEQGNFEMPNEDLLPLDVSDGFADEKKAHPEMMKFMGERVVPEMASLLGEEPYNPETHQGFGCFGCHTKAK